MRKENRIPTWIFLVVPVVYLIIALPCLVSRHQVYGSPLQYGAASKMLAESDAKAGAYNVPSPSVSEYIKTKGVFSLAKRFAGGFIKAVRTFIERLDPAWILMMLFGIARFGFNNLKRRSLFIVLLLYLLLLSPSYATMWSARYVFPLAPIGLFFGAQFLAEIFRTHDGKHALKGVFLGLALIYAFMGIGHTGFQFKKPQLNDVWAHWMIQNLHGTVVMQGGVELLFQAMPEEVINAKENRWKLYLSDAEKFGRTPYKLNVFRHGYYETASAALADFKLHHVEYIVATPSLKTEDPWLAPIINNPDKYGLELVQTFTAKPSEKWEMTPVTIYRLVR